MQDRSLPPLPVSSALSGVTSPPLPVDTSVSKFLCPFPHYSAQVLQSTEETITW